VRFGVLKKMDSVTFVKMNAGHLRMIGITSFVALVMIGVFILGLYFFGTTESSNPWYFLYNFKFWILVGILILFIFLMALWSYNEVNSILNNSKMQREFVNNVTHEIKTPLSTILLAAEVLNSDDLLANTIKRQQYIAIIRTEGEKLKNELERVLEVSRLPKIGGHLKKEWISPFEQTQRVVSTYQPILNQMNANLEMEWNGLEKLQLYFDRKSFEIIVSNLLDNALKYNIQDEPKIIIRAWIKMGEFNFSIEDNGLGIASEHLDQVFNRFYRVPISEIHHKKGFGLGLYLVQQLLRAHDSKVIVKSEEGVGSEFLVRIPMKNQENE
jgi:two-component system phosphate regulon sensor histidine kinase PhoR